MFPFFGKFDSIDCTMRKIKVSITSGVTLNALSLQQRTGVLSLPLRIGLLPPPLRPETGVAPLLTGLKR